MHGGLPVQEVQDGLAHCGGDNGRRVGGAVVENVGAGGPELVHDGGRDPHHLGGRCDEQGHGRLESGDVARDGSHPSCVAFRAEPQQKQRDQHFIFEFNVLTERVRECVCVYAILDMNYFFSCDCAVIIQR